MARKVRLPLDMGNDIMVRDIDELRENYNAEKVAEHFLSGQLVRWLSERYYGEELVAVKRLAKEADKAVISSGLAEIFNVSIDGEVDIDEVQYRNERVSRLREFTSDDDILANVEMVAFDQEELGDVLDEGYDTVYLCGEKFRLPFKVESKHYIGVNSPVISIGGEGEIDLEAKNITVDGCIFSKETQARLVIKESEDEPDTDTDYEEDEEDIEDKPSAQAAENTANTENSSTGTDYGDTDLERISVKGAKGFIDYFEKIEFSEEYLTDLGYCGGYYGDPSCYVPLQCSYKNKQINMTDLSSCCMIMKPMHIEFDNCVIYLPSPDYDQIVLEYGAKMQFNRCTIIGKREYSSPDITYKLFSICSTENDSLKREFSFTDCLFMNVNYFIEYFEEADRPPVNINFTSCHFINCYFDVVKCSELDDESVSIRNKVQVSGCVISQDGKDIDMFVDSFLTNETDMLLFNTNAKFTTSLFGGKKCELTADNNLIIQPSDTGGINLKVFRNNSSQINNSRYADPSDKNAVTSFWREF